VVVLSFIVFWALFCVNALIAYAIRFFVGPGVPWLSLAGLATVGEIAVIVGHSVEGLLMAIANKDSD
jgi:hypothetical protein